MQEHRYDGTDVITPNADIKKLEEALEKELNKAVTMHKPGSIITHMDGAQYVVQKNGSVRKIKGKD